MTYRSVYVVRNEAMRNILRSLLTLFHTHTHTRREPCTSIHASPLSYSCRRVVAENVSDCSTGFCRPCHLRVAYVSFAATS